MFILIPIGGIGTRFKNNGYSQPKALINVLGKPIVFWLLDNLTLSNNIDFIFIPYNKEYMEYKFEDLLIRLKKLDAKSDAETIQTEIYQIGKDHKFENLRDWFKLIYQVLFGKEDGPRFGTFVAIYGLDKTIE